ncbi:MAG: manganese-binding transcriptional regulator MntR [Phycisphaerales bacterium]|nr:manganese-binding transcriptional regulator MntR [Phycisphaerales bacterium]
MPASSKSNALGNTRARKASPDKAPKQKKAASPSGHANRFERIRRDHATELAEDYVELIDDLIADCGEARAVDLAKRLGVTQVTVTKTVARLKREGLVTSAPYRAIFLTDTGKRIADEARERHRIVLAFLRALGVPNEVAEIDAEGMEHHISPDTIAAMQAFIDRNG